MIPAFEYNARLVLAAESPVGRYLAVRKALSERARLELGRAVCAALKGTKVPHRALLKLALTDMGIEADRCNPPRG